MPTNFNYEPRHSYDDIRPKGGQHSAGVATLDAASGYDDIRPYRPRVASTEVHDQLATDEPEQGDTPEYVDGVENIETFEQAERLPNTFSDRTIVRMLNGELSGAVGAVPGALDIKSWADRADAGREWIEFARNPIRIAHLHAETAAMIGRNQHIFIDNAKIDGPARANIERQKRGYIRRIQYEDGTEAIIALSKWGRNPLDARGVGAALRYPKLMLDTNHGYVDVTNRSDGRIDGVRAKINIHEGSSGPSIHWFTDKFAREAVKNGHTGQTAYRIYLSPPPESTPQAFEAIMQALDTKDINAVGAMFDRATEAARNYQGALLADKGVKDLKTRAEGIVIAMDERDADTVLKFIREVYDFNQDLFKGQPVPKMAMRLNDGLAISAKPAQGKMTLNSHRSKVLGETVAEVRKQLGIGDNVNRKVSLVASVRARSLFRRIWAQKAMAARINPDNMSFNS